jgi:hypothetical protein
MDTSRKASLGALSEVADHPSQVTSSQQYSVVGATTLLNYHSTDEETEVQRPTPGHRTGSPCS